MKILLVGRGWTGRKMYDSLLKRGHEVHFISHHEAINSILNPSAIFPVTDWVVNCAGVTGSPNVDACESDRMGTLMGNAVFPIQLSEACEKKGIRFAHFSSGCIYSGNIDSVEADPNFFGSIYSISKGVSDVYLKSRALVFRIRMPFSKLTEPKNYLTKVYKYAKTGKLNNSGQNSLTDHDEAVKVACDLIEEGATGPHNLVNIGTIDMEELANLMGLNAKWFTPEEFRSATVAARSTCVIPDCGRMRPIREALSEALYEINAHA
jgi:dTDP-4-dehydrorhamnose reductase